MFALNKFIDIYAGDDGKSDTFSRVAVVGQVHLLSVVRIVALRVFADRYYWPALQLYSQNNVEALLR